MIKKAFLFTLLILSTNTYVWCMDNPFLQEINGKPNAFSNHINKEINCGLQMGDESDNSSSEGDESDNEEEENY